MPASNPAPPPASPQVARLRHIAVHVEEPSACWFQWVLTEQAGGAWKSIARAPAPAATYRQSMADGLLALQAMVPDLDLGPREHAASPSSRHADAADHPGHREKSGGNAAMGGRDKETAQGDSPPASEGGFFGFGPVA